MNADINLIMDMKSIDDLKNMLILHFRQLFCKKIENICAN